MVGVEMFPDLRLSSDNLQVPAGIYCDAPHIFLPGGQRPS